LIRLFPGGEEAEDQLDRNPHPANDQFSPKDRWLISGFGVVGRRVRIEALGG